MTVEECSRAAAARIPVVSGGLRYDRVSAVIKRFPTVVQRERGAPSYIYLVELEDSCKNSVTVTNPERVEKFTESEREQ